MLGTKRKCIIYQKQHCFTWRRNWNSFHFFANFQINFFSLIRCVEKKERRKRKRFTNIPIRYDYSAHKNNFWIQISNVFLFILFRHASLSSVLKRKLFNITTKFTFVDERRTTTNAIYDQGRWDSNEDDSMSMRWVGKWMMRIHIFFHHLLLQYLAYHSLSCVYTMSNTCKYFVRQHRDTRVNLNCI